MSSKFFDQIGGTIKVTLRGKNQERAINMASARGIFIWDIKKQGDDLDLKVRTSGFSALRNIADENDFELEVRDKKGLPFFKNVIRRRMAFIFGGIFFMLAMYLLSSFVWSVDVSGNKTVSRENIIMAAARHGVYPGAAKWSFSRSEAENALLNEVEDLSYVEIDLKGVKARIKVVEKIMPLKDTNGPRNIVAKKDGMIERILVLDGQPRVKTGDVVAKGDILISGLVIPEPNPYMDPAEQGDLEPSLVKARGEVRARVWYEGYGECRLKDEIIKPGSRKQSKLYLVTPGKTFSLNIKHRLRFPYYSKSSHCYVIGTPWGDLGFKRVIFKEKRKNVHMYTEEQALARAKELAWKDLKSKLRPGGRLTNSRVKMISSPSEPIIRVKVSAESIENITLVQPINTQAK